MATSTSTTSKPTLSYSKYATRSTIYKRNEWRRDHISDVRLNDPRPKVVRILSGLPIMNQIFEPYEQTLLARRNTGGSSSSQQSSSSGSSSNRSLSDDLSSLGNGTQGTSFNQPTVIDFSGGIPSSSNSSSSSPWSSFQY